MVKLQESQHLFLETLQESADRNGIIKRIQHLKSDDWNKLYVLAAKTGLFPVFYSRLLSLKLENIPPEFLSRLKEPFFFNLKRNLLLEKELLEILSYFEKLNIPVIPLKGPTLARYLYNDLALRQASGDLDLLVRYEAIGEVKERLAELGYRICGTEHKRDFLSPVGLSKQIRQVIFVKHLDKTLSINLDLHWCIRGFFVDTHIQDLWQQAGSFNLNGQRILVFSNEDALLYLSVISISILEFVQLKYIYDIHRLITVFGKDLDWDRLLYKAKQLNLESCLYFPLALSKSLFFTHIPKTSLNEIQPNRVIRDLIKIYINEKSVLESGQKTKFNYLSRYLLGRYLYSHSPSDFLRKSFRRALRKSSNPNFTAYAKEPIRLRR